MIDPARGQREARTMPVGGDPKPPRRRTWPSRRPIVATAAARRRSSRGDQRGAEARRASERDECAPTAACGLARRQVAINKAADRALLSSRPLRLALLVAWLAVLALATNSHLPCRASPTAPNGAPGQGEFAWANQRVESSWVEARRVEARRGESSRMGANELRATSCARDHFQVLAPARLLSAKAKFARL